MQELGISLAHHALDAATSLRAASSLSLGNSAACHVLIWMVGRGGGGAHGFGN
jgi:hypothetical protein